LLSAYVEQKRIKNKWRALYQLMGIRDQKPNLLEQFSIYRLRNSIENELIEADLILTEMSGVDVVMVVDSQNKFYEFQCNIDKTVRCQIDFWRELLEDNPDIHK
jgi:hypothetical protein